MDIKEFSPRHVPSYVDYLKRLQGELTFKLADARAKLCLCDSVHSGRSTLKRRVDTLGMMLDMTIDAITREKR